VASFNKIILVGNLTRDPQLSYNASNVAVCKFGIATNHKRKDREGNVKEEVCFVDCTVFGRAGETFNQYMAKGRTVLVEGRLELQQWTSQEGEKKSKHAVIVENFTFLGSPGGGGGQGGGAPAARRSAPEPSAVPSGAPVEDYDFPAPAADDIPF
jgi:single-strand DNA-binding protein